MSKTVSGTTTQFAWDQSGGLPLLVDEQAGTQGMATARVNARLWALLANPNVSGLVIGHRSGRL